MEEFLSAFDLTSFSFFIRLNKSLSREGFWPWAIVMFPDEYPIAGHIMVVRGNREDVLFTAYGAKGRGEPQHWKKQLPLFESALPPVSVLLIRAKEDFERIVEYSPVFRKVWKVLEDMGESRHWLYLADSLDSALVESIKDNV